MEEMETITSVSSQLFSIQTLPNVGSELLGIQENQKDAEPRQKEKGRWYKTGVSRITRHSKDTAQCRSRITRHSRGPKGRQFQKQGRWRVVQSQTNRCVELIIQHKNTAQCRSRITRHSGGPKGRRAPSKEKGSWYKTGVSRITRHSKYTVQCRSRITRHSRGPKGRQFQKQGVRQVE